MRAGPDELACDFERRGVRCDAGAGIRLAPSVGQRFGVRVCFNRRRVRHGLFRPCGRRIAESSKRRAKKAPRLRLAGQTAEHEAAAAKAFQATAAKRRTDQLLKSGVSTVAESDRVRYESAAASSAETAAERRLEETRVEHDAIAQGVFIGDSYNDSPSSEQRAAELRLRAGELDAQAEVVRSQMKVLTDQIADEEARYREHSEVFVDLPTSGRVWEMRTGPGERVGKGQDLMRVLDCSHPLVSANVDESVYNRLEVGGRATFRPSQGGGRAYRGTIVNLTGAAAASGNFAIPPVAMRKSPFYVTIAVNSVKEGGCSVGRTGTVTFETSAGPSTSDEAAPLNSAPEDASPLRPA